MSWKKAVIIGAGISTLLGAVAGVTGVLNWGVTQLPAYKELEARLDSLETAHTDLRWHNKFHKAEAPPKGHGGNEE